MQGYHPSRSNHGHSNQPYYPSNQYVSQPQVYTTYNPFPTYVQQPANGQPLAAPYPPDTYEPPLHAFPQFSTPATHNRPLNRSQSAATPSSRPAPLKSIMKKTPHDRSATGDAYISRQNSRTDQLPTRPRANSSTRPSFDALPSFTPEHLFVTFGGSNELRLENIAYQMMIDELRENLLPLWHHGVSSEETRTHRWRAQFNGNPWAASGTDGILARRLICRLFTLLNSQGYAYLSTINTSSSPCKLIFSQSEVDQQAYFFSICISHSGDKTSILDCPPHLSEGLSNNLRKHFPRKVTFDRVARDGEHIIELKRSMTGPEVEKSLFTACILRFFKVSGFNLDGSLPIGRARPLGTKKDLWIFRGSMGPMTRPESAHSRYASNGEYRDDMNGHFDR